MAAIIPKRDGSKAGRPNHHPDHVYLLVLAILGIHGSHRSAIAWLREDTNWYKVRSHARRFWDIELATTPPKRSTVTYNLDRLSPYADLLSDKFTLLAIEQAQKQGCLIEGPETMSKPKRGNILVADGTVPKTRITETTRKRLIEKGVKLPEVDEHREGGEDKGVRVLGFKELLVAVRPDAFPNSRIILSRTHVPKEKGYGGEAGIAVREMEKLRKLTKGFLGLRYDGAMTGMHLDAMLKLGVSAISPVPKDNIQRMLYDIDCTCGNQHTLHTEGGEFVELDVLDTGKTYSVPCKRVEQYSRKNADGTHRWYAKLLLMCGEHRTERLDTTAADKKLGFNRAHHVRLHPPESQYYKDTYGYRADIESVNNNLDSTLYRHRMITDTKGRQALVVLGFAMARNAISAEVYAARLKAGHFSDPPKELASAA
ncbi:hypothetical protein [Pseudarthrobacter equi]|nr:hypothetical protein [Pseudarthrobacter equi]